MGGAVSAAINYDAFWMLNALVNQYKWHCVGLYNRLHSKGTQKLHYHPIIWSMDRLFKNSEDEVLVRLRSFCKPFPGPTAFQGSMFSTFFPYIDSESKQEGGGGLVEGILRTGALVTVTRSFASLNQLWNEFRWYLLELRRLHGDLEVKEVEHTYVSRAAALPMGKLIRGISFTQPIDDPNLQGLEGKPTLKRFVDEVWAGQQQLRRSSSGRSSRSSSRKQSNSRKRRSTRKNTP